MDRDALRAEMERVRTAVAAAVNRVDLEGLIALDAPEDEYTPEIGSLTGLVLRGQVTEDAVKAIWETWFGPGSAAVRHPDGLAELVSALKAVPVGSAAQSVSTDAHG